MHYKVAVWFLLCCLAFISAAAQSAAQTSCDAVLKDYFALFPKSELALEHLRVDEQSHQQRAEKPYMQVLRNMGLKQVTAEIDVLWDGGIVQAQAVNVKFSDSYKYDPLPEGQFKDINPAQIRALRQFFRLVMAQQAKEDLPEAIRGGFVAKWQINEPVLLATFGYTLFDTPCIPPLVPGQGSEDITPVRELLTMKPIH